ncbi:unnamed protein product, partial [Prorocentrum cordatum]
ALPRCQSGPRRTTSPAKSCRRHSRSGRPELVPMGPARRAGTRGRRSSRPGGCRTPGSPTAPTRRPGQGHTTARGPTCRPARGRPRGAPLPRRPAACPPSGRRAAGVLRWRTRPPSRRALRQWTGRCRRTSRTRAGR